MSVEQMREARSGKNSWQFKTPLGTLRCGTLAGQVDVARPHLGLHELSIGGAPRDGMICGVNRCTESQSTDDWPATLADAYVRGGDLVATYQATDVWPFAPQVYWRAEAPESTDEVPDSISLLVSVSTHLLDTCPRIETTSRLVADEVLHVSPSDDDGARATSITGTHESVLHPSVNACCIVWRLPGGKLSYAEIMPASDFRQLRVQHQANGACEARWELFADFLEKGVIRRARLQAAFLPRRDDVRLAAAYCRLATARPLPLTT